MVALRKTSFHEIPAPMAAPAEHRIAVLIPCFNEAATIADVVRGFRAVLPGAQIYVYDNNSRDGTAAIARDVGASVGVERRQGKGHVICRMFSDIEADCYLMVDGDNTYDPAAAVEAVDLVAREGCDFVNIARVSRAHEAYRRGHRFGNLALNGMVRSFFGREVSDMLSGYKVFSRRFIKSFPALSGGFEIETELTVHALGLRMAMAEISAPYKERPSGSASKLRTFHDGARILLLILRLVKDERPFPVFGALGLTLAVVGIVLGGPVVTTFLATGLVPRLPTAVLAVGFVVLGTLSLMTGIVLDVVTKARQELKRLAYLAIPRKVV